MNCTVHHVDQRSPEWAALRLGRLTASRAADMCATIKSGEAAARRNLRVQLVLERLTGRPHERAYQSGPMQDGIEREPAAVAYYEAVTGTLLQPVGFIAHNELMAGCSPDSVVNDFEGVVQIKCPIPATHLDYIKTGRVPTDYLWQITQELWLTEADWCDWLSFQPDFPEAMRAKLVRVYRKDIDIAAYDQKARAFLYEVDRELQALRTMVAPVEQMKAVVGL